MLRLVWNANLALKSIHYPTLDTYHSEQTQLWALHVFPLKTIKVGPLKPHTAIMTNRTQSCALKGIAFKLFERKIKFTLPLFQSKCLLQIPIPSFNWLTAGNLGILLASRVYLDWHCLIKVLSPRIKWAPVTFYLFWAPHEIVSTIVSFHLYSINFFLYLFGSISFLFTMYLISSWNVEHFFFVFVQ